MQISLNNNFPKYSWLALVILTGLFLFFCTRNCKPHPPKPIDIGAEVKKKDSFRVVIKYRDSIRIERVIKYRYLKQNKDSLPCNTLIEFIELACDTIIKVDSLEITALKKTLQLDSAIIFKQGLMLKSDSVYIGKLSRKLKRQKFLTKAAFVLGLGAGGYVGTKLP